MAAIQDHIDIKLVDGRFVCVFEGTTVTIGQPFDTYIDAVDWISDNLRPKHKLNHPNPLASDTFKGQQAGEEIKDVLKLISDEFPGATEYIHECLKKFPTQDFYTKKEKMYADLKGIDIYGWKQVDAALANGKKVEAVKIVRRGTGLGLKEAKNLVDARADSLNKQARECGPPNVY